MESSRVRYTDIEIVPRVFLNQKACNVPHPTHVNAPCSPILILGPPKIPRDPTHRDEVIPATGSLEVRLILDPPQHRVAMQVPLARSVVGPEVAIHCEPDVEWDVESGCGFRVGGPTFVGQDPVVEDYFYAELVRPVPRRDQILRHDSVQSIGSASTEPAIR